MLNLFAAEFRRNFLEFMRYPAEALLSVIILVILFYGLFLGASYVAGPQVEFGERLDAIVVGYVVWIMALHSLTSVAGELQKEAQTGPLQQVFTSIYGPTWVLVFRTVTDILLNLLITLAVLFAILILMQRTLEFSPLALVAVGSVLLGSFGLAFLMGAVALRYKRVEQLINLGQFALLFLMVTPFETMEGMGSLVQYFLPMVAGTGVLRQILARGVEVDWNVLALAYCNGIVYALVGLLVFRQTTFSVRRKGTLGWY